MRRRAMPPAARDGPQVVVGDEGDAVAVQRRMAQVGRRLARRAMRGQGQGFVHARIPTCLPARRLPQSARGGTPVGHGAGAMPAATNSERASAPCRWRMQARRRRRRDPVRLHPATAGRRRSCSSAAMPATGRRAAVPGRGTARSRSSRRSRARAARVPARRRRITDAPSGTRSDLARTASATPSCCSIAST